MIIVTTINHIKHSVCAKTYLLLYTYYAGVSLSDQERKQSVLHQEKVDVDPLLLGPFSPGCLRVCFIASLLVSSFCSLWTVGVQQSDFEFDWTEIQCTSFTQELFATLRPLNYGIQLNIAVIKGKQFWKMYLFDLKHCQLSSFSTFLQYFSSHSFLSCKNVALSNMIPCIIQNILRNIHINHHHQPIGRFGAFQVSIISILITITTLTLVVSAHSKLQVRDREKVSAT